MPHRCTSPRSVAIVGALVGAIAGLTTAACAPVGGPLTLEILVADPEAQHGVRLEDAEVQTITDLGAGKGSLFNVRGGLRMAAFEVLQSARAGDDFDTMRTAARGDGGADLSPSMRMDGPRYVALDFETLAYFTIAHHIEAAWLFARDDVLDDSGATQDPALVGVSSSIVAANLLPIPVQISDNAAYAGPLDAWLTLRVGAQQGVPFAMSFPVLAHEFHHRVFHRNVFTRSPAAFDVWRSNITAENPTVEQARAARLLKGIDEGLADVFSLAATSDVAGLSRTFTDAAGPFVNEAGRRDINGDFARNATYENLDAMTLDATLLSGCGGSEAGELFAQESFNFYCLGTVLARALWVASDEDIEVLRTEVEPAVNHALPHLSDTLVAGASSGVLFDIEQILEPIAAELPSSARRSTACAAFEEKFSSHFSAALVPSCF